MSVDCSPALNVIVGDNATGKSQLLKIAYVASKTVRESEELTKKDLSGSIGSKLKGVFRPDALGRLVRRVQGSAKGEVELKFAQIGQALEFSFSSHAKKDVTVSSVPNRPLEDEPVFLPPHELLTLSASFVSLYDNYDIGFDETWRDTIDLLLRPALRGPRAQEANDLYHLFSELLQKGTVIEEDGKFYLKQKGIGKLEAPLLAEGQRKLAMIARLIANGVLLNGGYLFWDEPESNLNPASQQAVAKALFQLARSGVQIFVATHSMFLIRELQMLSEKLEVAPRYIGLTRVVVDGSTSEPAARVDAQVADDLDDLDYIAALEAEVIQADHYLAW